RAEAEAAPKDAEAQAAIAQEQRQKAEQAVVALRRASAAARIATESRLMAERSRVQAMTAAALAGQDELRTRRLLYAVHMSQAQQAWDEANFARTDKLLGNYLPDSRARQPTGTPTDVRGFEWFYLWRLTHNARATVGLERAGTPYLMALSRDGQRVAVASTGSDIHLAVWDATSGQAPLSELKANNDYVSALALSPDETMLATGHSEGVVKLWDLASGRELARVKQHPPSSDATESVLG